jgi:hypothetical protein
MIRIGGEPVGWSVVTEGHRPQNVVMNEILLSLGYTVGILGLAALALGSWAMSAIERDCSEAVA